MLIDSRRYVIYLLPPINKYTKYWKQVVNVYKAILLDRTDTIDFGFNYKTISPIPRMSEYTYSFSDTCDYTATNILKNSNGKPINIYWSGGIDSTAVLVSFLKNSDNLNNINITLSKDSIEEYPLFFNNFILDKIKFTVSENPMTLVNTDFINVTGELGDQIFGSASIFTANDKGKLFDKYTNYLSESFIEVISEQLNKCPIELNSVFDILWWINFSMKYQYVQLRIYADILKPFGSILHYFDTQEFQLWSLNNHDKKIKSTIESYKYMAKDYIYDFTKDSDYRDYKLKVNSLKLNTLKYSIDENFICKRYIQ